jgi:hypothetical protein
MVPAAALLQRQAGLGAVERLDLALLVDGQHDGVRRRIDIEPDDVAQLVDEVGVVRELELANRCGCRPCARQMRWTELTLMPDAFAIKAPVQWVVSPGGSPGQRDDALGDLAPERRMREGRVLSRSRPSKPSSMNRSCQRQTQVLDLPVSPHDLVRADAVGGQQDDLGSPDMLLRALRSRRGSVAAAILPFRAPAPRAR